MVFCSQCREELPETANFCFKCGVMTKKGVDTGVPSPWKWDDEVEKTLSTVAKELEQTFKTLKESIKKSIKKDPITCPSCQETNPHDAKFCYKCGRELLD